MNEIEIKKYIENHFIKTEKLKEQSELKNKRKEIEKTIIKLVFITVTLFIWYILTDIITTKIENITEIPTIKQQLSEMALVPAVTIIIYMVIVLLSFAIINWFKYKIRLKNDKVNINKLKKEIAEEKEKIVTSEQIIEMILLKKNNIKFNSEYLPDMYNKIFNTPELLKQLQETENESLEKNFFDYLIKENKKYIIKTRIKELKNDEIKIEN